MEATVKDGVFGKSVKEELHKLKSHFDDDFKWGKVKPYLSIEIHRDKKPLMETTPVHLLDVEVLRKPMGYVDENMTYVSNFNVHGTEMEVLGLDKLIRHPIFAREMETCTITTRGDTFEFEVPSIYIELLGIRNAHVDCLQFALNEANVFVNAAKHEIDTIKKKCQEEELALKKKQVDRSKHLSAKIQVAQTETKHAQKELMKKLGEIKTLKANFAWLLKQLQIKDWTTTMASAFHQWSYLSCHKQREGTSKQSLQAQQKQISKEQHVKTAEKLYKDSFVTFAKQQVFAQWLRLIDFRNTEAYLTVESCFRNTMIQNLPNFDIFELRIIEGTYANLPHDQKTSLVLSQEGYALSFVYKCVIEVGNLFYPRVNADMAYNMIVKFCKESTGFEQCQDDSDFSDWVTVREYFCMLFKFTLRNLYDLRNTDKEHVYHKLYMFRPYFQRVVMEEQSALQQRLEDLNQLQRTMERT